MSEEQNPAMGASEQPDPELEAQMILLAASHHDIETLRTLLRTGSANVQDPDTGYTPLHCAIAALAPEPEHATPGAAEGEQSNGQLDADAMAQKEKEREDDIQAAARTMRLLLQNGAIWNDLDNNDETPGCLARRLRLRELYEIMVDAGVRAELLLNRLDEYEPLGDDDEDDDEPEEGEADNQDDKEKDATTTSAPEDQVDTANTTTQPTPIATEDNAATGPTPADPTDASTLNPAYLSSTLSITPHRILDASANAVMMSWETSLMQSTARLLAPVPGLRILNIGHGMGIIDQAFRDAPTPELAAGAPPMPEIPHTPSDHVIVEAHPDVLRHMGEQGWHSRPGVRVLGGRWQDVVPQLVENGDVFDAIFFDTFAEDYKALRDFFTEYVVALLEPDGGRFSFFNGMGADRAVCYDVYNKVVEMDLFEAGFDVEWSDFPIPSEGLKKSGTWDGVRRAYWDVQNYRTPLCRFMQ
ncbi:MAG: hypothetical protein M1819_002465 [Sarea resinae]|nr:MAG: hypothetical protein M1819_002465 [Sarea resinae]